MSLLSKKVVFALSLLLFLPAIAVVAAPPGVHIGQPSIAPTSPGPSDQVTVTTTVTANAGVKNVTLHYTTDNWKHTNTTVVASYNSTSNQATAHIPPLYNGGTVQYYMEAFDNNGNSGVNNSGGNYFTYTVVGTSASAATSMWIEIAILSVVVGAAASVAIFTLRPRKNTN